MTTSRWSCYSKINVLNNYQTVPWFFFQTRKKLAWYNNIKILSNSRDCKRCHFFGSQTASLPNVHILRAPKTSVTIFLPDRRVDCAQNLFHAVALGKHCYIFPMKGKDFLDYTIFHCNYCIVSKLHHIWLMGSISTKKKKCI